MHITLTAEGYFKNYPTSPNAPTIGRAFGEVGGRIQIRTKYLNAVSFCSCSLASIAVDFSLPRFRTFLVNSGKPKNLVYSESSINRGKKTPQNK